MFSNCVFYVLSQNVLPYEEKKNTMQGHYYKIKIDFGRQLVECLYKKRETSKNYVTLQNT